MLHVVVALCWLPVAWAQMTLRGIAVSAAANGEQLPVRYGGYLGAWAALGVPALVVLPGDLLSDGGQAVALEGRRNPIPQPADQDRCRLTRLEFHVEIHAHHRAMTMCAPAYERQSHWRNAMLRYAVVFFVVAIIAAVLGFSGIAGTASNIAWILFVVFLALAVISLIRGRRPV